MPNVVPENWFRRGVYENSRQPNPTFMATNHRLFSGQGVSGIEIKNWKISATKKEILNAEELEE